MEELTSVTGKNVNKNTDTWVDSTEEVTVGNIDFFFVDHNNNNNIIINSLFIEGYTVS